MGDFDGYAVEVALQLVEKAGSGEVVVISLGPDGVQEILRKALAMGATRAVQLKADEVPFDGLAIARALAAELKDGGYDLILFGRMATDTASGTVGPMVAELLGLPCVTAISRLEIESGRGTAGRELEGAAETVTFPLPAVLTIDEGIARPRLASLKGIMAAKKKPLEVKPAALGTPRAGGREHGACRPSAPAGASWARGPTRCPSWCGCSGPKRRCSDGRHVRVRRGAGRSSSARWRLEAVTAARQAADASGGGEVHALLVGAPGHRGQGGGAGPLRRRRGHRGRARRARALQSRSRRRDGGGADPVGRLPRRVLLRFGRGPGPGARASRRGWA